MELGYAISSEEHAPNDLPTPDHFKAAAKLVQREDIKGSIVLGPDPQQHIHQIQEYADKGIEQVYIHQIGPDQEGFFSFYQKEILP